MPQYEVENVNPFINTTLDLGIIQKAKLVVFGIVLGLPRLILMLFILIWMYFFSVLVTLGHDETFPMSKWRKFCQHPIYYGLRIQLFLFGFIWVKVKGRPVGKHIAPIMVSNHICPFEPIFLLYYTKASVLQRSEDSKVPIIGRVQKALQVLFVDRKSEESRKGIIKLINERSCESNLFPKMLIFPEGTCTNQSAIITFKNGPFHPGKTVQPILVRYMFRWMDPSFPAVSPSLRQLATRIACQVYNSMEIEFLDPYFPSSEEKVNAALYANNVRLLMAKKLGVPATHHAYEDAALQFEARACFPQHSMKEFIVEWGKVRKVLEIDSNSAKKYLRAFILLDKDKDGRLSYDEFVAAWRENNFEEQGSVVFANEKSSKNFSVPILPSGNDEMHLPVILSNEKQKDSKTAQKDGQSGVFEKELKRVCLFSLKSILLLQIF